MDRVLKKKKWPPRRIAGAIVIVVFFSMIFYYIVFGDKSSKLNVKKERITISTVSEGLFNEFIPIVGNVMPIKTIYLDATQGGQVEKIYLEAGSQVKINDRILKLSNTNLLLDIMYQEAQLIEATNNLRNTRLAMEQNKLRLRSELVEADYQIRRLKRQYERQIDLVEKNVVSKEEFENVKDEYEYQIKRRKLAIESQRQDSLFREVQISQLESSVERMRANMEIVNQKLENLVIKAPIAGLLTSLNAEIGQSKSQGERLGQIDVLDSFKVRAGIDEHYIARIETGKKGSFDFAGDTYHLVVRKIFPEVTDGRFETDLYFRGDVPEGIRRGQTLHIRLELGDLKEAILLPRGGFFQKTGGQWVYVVDESGGYAYQRKITLGRKNPQVFEVLDGLEIGEQVITSSYDSFGDNEKLILD